jgi:hypothetical protein
MKNLLFTSLFFLNIIIGSNSYSQCFEFVKTNLTKLDTAKYVFDGRLNTLQLTEGDYVEVYKPFYKNRSYRVFVISENLTTVNFKITNTKENTMFNNAEHDNVNYWEYTPVLNQNLKISVSVPRITAGNEIKTGCVAVIIGYKKSKN